MNARVPLPDWRDALRGIPIATITADGIKPLGSGDKHHTDDETARSAIERMSERVNSARPKGGRG